MNINVFIEKLAEAMEVENPSTISADTIFRDMDEWGSLSYLSLIALFDQEFDIQIEDSELKRLKTIQDLYDRATM